ncbi:hypothetical protein [Anoxybacteroides rupiense]|uniref:hypothetical protein n=1 Tax=Anoxybacteroides rupiense TaxID=311460 RepID=UPI00366C2205
MAIILRVFRTKDFWLNLLYTVLSIPSVFIIVFATNPSRMFEAFANKDLVAIFGMFLVCGFFIGSFVRDVIYYIEEALKEERTVEIQRSS